MPLYDFHCEQCETQFEVRASIKEKQAGLQPECPTCHSHVVRQMVTAGLVLRMTNQSPSLGGSDGVIVVQIVGAPLACADGIKDTWREVARHTADQLIARFGASIRVQYFDLFDADCPALPDGAQLPLVLIAGEVLSRGGKISTPAIRKQIEALSIMSHGHRS